jgi:hypothetical protein
MLSTVELAGKSIPSITSGLLAEAVGCVRHRRHAIPRLDVLLLGMQLQADLGCGFSFVVRRYQYVFALGAGCSVLFVLFVVGILLRGATTTMAAGKTQ